MKSRGANLVFWKMAWRGLVRNRRRHLLSGIALAFGYCGLILLGGYMLRVDKYLAVQSIYLNHTGHISLFKKDGLERHLPKPQAYNLSAEEQKKIREVLSREPDVEHVAPTLNGAALVSNGCTSYPVLITAIESDFQKWAREHNEVKIHTPELTGVKYGEGFWVRDEKSNPANISPFLAEQLGKKMIAREADPNRPAKIIDCDAADASDRIAADPDVQLVSTSFTGGVAALDVEIAGHVSTGLSLKDETDMTMPLSSAQNLFQTDMVTSFSIYLREGAPVKGALKRLRELMTEAGLEVDLYPYNDDHVSQYYVGAMNFVYVMVGFFLVLVCGVVVLSVVNALNISLLERKTEIATLRAIGYRPIAITKIFLRENLLLGLFSFSMGGVAAYFIKTSVNAANWRFTVPAQADDLQFMLKPTLTFGLSIMAVLILVVEIATLSGCLSYMKQKITNLLAAA